MTNKKKNQLKRALEKIASACEDLHEIEMTLDADDREAWREEAAWHLAAGYEAFGKDEDGTVGAFLNPCPDDWDLRQI